MKSIESNLIKQSFSSFYVGRFDTWSSNYGFREQFLEFIIFNKSHKDESRNNSSLLLLSNNHNRNFKNFSYKILKNSSKVYWSSKSNSLAVSSGLQHSSDSSHRERKSSSAGSAYLFRSVCFSFSFSFSSFCHYCNLNKKILNTTPYSFHAPNCQ